METNQMKRLNIVPINISIPLPNMPGKLWTITPTLLSSEDSLILIDTGMPGMIEEIASQMEAAGFSIEQLTGIVLTHQDIDHVGSVTQIMNIHPEIDIYAHAQDKPYIEGDIPPFKPLHETLVKKIEDNYIVHAREIVNHMISDEDILDCAGGIIAVHTPGHTPGHISLYHPATKTLIAGDALTNNEGQLEGPNPKHTPDMEEAYRSLSKLSTYDIEKVICYHGGLYDQPDVNKRIAEIAASRSQD